MEWIEWLVGREFRQFIIEHNLFVPLLFLGRAVVVTTVELMFPARRLSYRSVIGFDLIGATAVGFVLIPASEFLSRPLALRFEVPSAIAVQPLGFQFLLYYAVGDFGAYWMHRFMHAGWTWRVHKWHHSPRTMYWLAGYRTSLPQQVLFNIPWIAAFSMFHLPPWWMGLAVLSSHMVLNDWMHMNVSWNSRRLEWLLVTPRFHHIHHSREPAHYLSNFGVTFTLWDRLFGTFLDPDHVKEPLEFGIGEKVPLARLVAGI